VAKEASNAVHLTEIIWNALAHKSTVAPELKWISAFDQEDKQRMAEELMSANRAATRDGNWGELDNTMHEWSESGWAALNQELTNNYNEAVKSTE
jgi:hypothetical protein